MYARKWLRALQVLYDAAEPAAAKPFGTLTAPPVEHLPAGIAANHIDDGGARGSYRQGANINRLKADELAFQLQCERLKRIFKPLATRFVTAIRGKNPHDLNELKKLLNQYLPPDPRKQLNLPAPITHLYRSPKRATAGASHQPGRTKTENTQSITKVVQEQSNVRFPSFAPLKIDPRGI